MQEGPSVQGYMEARSEKNQMSEIVKNYISFELASEVQSQEKGPGQREALSLLLSQHCSFCPLALLLALQVYLQVVSGALCQQVFSPSSGPSPSSPLILWVSHGLSPPKGIQKC